MRTGVRWVLILFLSSFPPSCTHPTCICCSHMIPRPKPSRASFLPDSHPIWQLTALADHAHPPETHYVGRHSDPRSSSLPISLLELIFRDVCPTSSHVSLCGCTGSVFRAKVATIDRKHGHACLCQFTGETEIQRREAICPESRTEGRESTGDRQALV